MESAGNFGLDTGGEFRILRTNEDDIVPDEVDAQYANELDIEEPDCCEGCRERLRTAQNSYMHAEGYDYVFDRRSTIALADRDMAVFSIMQKLLHDGRRVDEMKWYLDVAYLMQEVVLAKIDLEEFEAGELEWIKDAAEAEEAASWYRQDVQYAEEQLKEVQEHPPKLVGNNEAADEQVILLPGGTISWALATVLVDKLALAGEDREKAMRSLVRYGFFDGDANSETTEALIQGVGEYRKRLIDGFDRIKRGENIE